MSQWNHSNLNSGDHKRVIFIALFILALFSLLIMQFFKIQILEGDQWTKVGDRQHYFWVSEPFKRGTFFSNTSIKKNHPESAQNYVIDIKKFHLYIDPLAIPKEHKKPIIKYFNNLFGLTEEHRQVLISNFFRKSRSRKLAMWLDLEVQETILKWWLPYAKKNKIPRNSLFFVSDYKRSYPFGKQLGQVLHTIQVNKDEVTKQAIPTGGLELYFNPLLSGKLGKKRLMRSPRNAFETGVVVDEPEHGANVYLTINHCLQEIAEEEIEKGVKKCKAKAGWAVMMNPDSGEVLALAQYPFFYPPDYQDFFNDSDKIDATRVKAITDAHEPGSVFKPFSIAIALMANDELVRRGEKPLFSVDEKIATSNGNFPGRKKPITDTRMHSFLNMQMALQKSSNVYLARLFERIINRLGKDWLRQALTQFGFGEKTHIELFGESRGVVPTPGKKHANGTDEWSTPTPFSLAFGHNIQVTSLQLLRAYAVFANGGYLIQPTLVKKIEKGDDSRSLLVDNSLLKKEDHPQVLSKAIAGQVVDAMRFITKPGGTAPRADVWGYTEAGKTSTAKKIVNGAYSETAYVATFIGFTPVKNPSFILLVVMDEPEYGYIPGLGKNHHGGTCAAPVFREISRRVLEYLGIPLDDPFGYPSQDPRFDKEKADWMPQIRKLQEMYEKWNNKEQKANA